VWWGSSFNFDYRENYQAYKETAIIKNYLEWQYFSHKDPLFVFNVDWIQHSKNLFKTIHHMKANNAALAKKNITYNDMVKIFTKPVETGQEAKPTPRSKAYKLYYDIAQSIYLDTHITLNVGDPVVMKNGEPAFIYSFIGFANGGDIKYVQLEMNGKKFIMAFTDGFKKFMLDQIHQYRFAQSVPLKNGAVITPGCILSIKMDKNNVYKKVDYIRRGRVQDGEEIFEVKSGPNYYLSHELDATVFILEKPVMYDIKVKKDKDYLFIKEPDSPSALVPASKVKFDNIDVSIDGNLIAKFTNTGVGVTGEKHSFGLDSERKMPLLLDMKEVRPITNEVFRIGRRFFTIKRDSKAVKYGAWFYNGTVLYENYYSLAKSPAENVKDLIKDDTFSISGPDFDTSFTIGDKVVVANWNNPIDVLNVKTIQGFKYEATSGNISFILLTNDGKLIDEPYLLWQDGTIKTGYIRKVTNKFDKLSVGTKIIAKESGICNFPKKDINIIVAIVIDGPHEPLILCSNGCTLWYSTVMKDFQKITMKSKKWETLKHAPLDISKIKFQAGDIINGRRDYKRESGFIIFDPSTTRYLKVLPISYYTGFPDHQTFDKYFMADAIFESIPTPRLTIAQQTKLGTIKGFVDFHGTIIKDNHNRNILPFINERG
jgi:hypothetical protein